MTDRAQTFSPFGGNWALPLRRLGIASQRRPAAVEGCFERRAPAAPLCGDFLFFGKDLPAQKMAAGGENRIRGKWHWPGLTSAQPGPSRIRPGEARRCKSLFDKAFQQQAKAQRRRWAGETLGAAMRVWDGNGGGKGFQRAPIAAVRACQQQEIGPRTPTQGQENAQPVEKQQIAPGKHSPFVKKNTNRSKTVRILPYFWISIARCQDNSNAFGCFGPPPR